MKSVAALSVVVLATSASASPFTTILLAKVPCSGAYLKGSPDADRACAAFLKSRTACGPTTIPVTNLNYSLCTTSVGSIGSQSTYYNLVVDTGSSNTFCGQVWMIDRSHATYDSCYSTGTPYVRTSTSIPTGEAVSVTYGSGNFT